MQYAQVVVHVPYVSTPAPASVEVPAPTPYAWLDRSFTYAIPEGLRDLIRLGQLVWVPFGSRELQGIVADLSDTTELAETREVQAIVYPEPLLTLQQIDLAGWISHRYLAPLADCIWLFLPPGIEDKVETYLEVAPEVNPKALTEKQLAFVEKIRAGGEIKVTALNATQRTMANALVTRGILLRRTTVRPGKAKPRRVDAVRLNTSRATALAILAGLDRRTSVLRALSSASAPLTDAQLAIQTRATDSTLALMEGQGLVTRIPRTSHYKLTEAYRDQVPALPVEQSRVCVYLREHSGSASASELEDALSVKPGTLNTLRDKGWLEKTEEPARWTVAAKSAVPPLSPAHARLKRVIEFIAAESPPIWVSALYAATDAKRADLQKLEQLGLLALETTEKIRDPLQGRTFTPVPPPTLTTEQQKVWRQLEPSLSPSTVGSLPRGTRGHPSSSPSSFLLHGVTGSGKTEIYLDAIDRILAQGKQAIALVPEISLTPQTIRRFGARFGERIGVIHSHLTPGERYDTWRRIRDGQIDVVIGARSALFAPLPRLGLVVIDEEHDASYKNDLEYTNQPAYHAREIALEMARSHNIITILGSATPDVETYAHAERGEIQLLTLPQRVIAHEPVAAVASPQWQPGAPSVIRYQDLPPVEIVDLRAELKEGNRSIFSRSLHSALTETLARGEQAILFLNRRGTSSAVVCRDCGHALRCSRCNNPYTLHQFGDETARELVCHHCGKRATIPKKCPNCGSTRIRGLGLGTEKLEEQVRAEFPQARPLRWDYDSTQGKDAHELLLDAFLRDEANVMIGTQMIAKGLDLPNVTLVGIVNADTSLWLPDFRAGERTFQILTQVAGRAGRSAHGGRAILQTYNPENYAIQAAARHDYAAFYVHEIAFRRTIAYPPFGDLTRLLYRGDSLNEARTAAEKFAAQLTDTIRRQGILNVELIGPAPAFFAKQRGKYRHQILLRGQGAVSLLSLYPPPSGWRIDVDPLDLL